MRSLITICIISLCFTFCCAKSDDITVEYFTQLINSRQSSWRAGQFDSENTTNRAVIRATTPTSFFTRGRKIKACNLENIKIPESFDARTHWPECEHIIGKIMNQGRCRSCWALSATAVMSDRLCIESKGKTKVEFSAQDLVSCCSYCGTGCGKGYPIYAWSYWIKHGIVSGGGFGSVQGCKPYLKSEYFYGTRSNCTKSCENPYYNISYNEDKHFGSEYYFVNSTPECIQAEIMKNGPVQALMKEFEDFVFYKDGVYFYTLGSQVTSHSVKILGWGTERGLPYWLVANSWGCSWGNLGGFVKIRRGHNECGIEEYVIGGHADLGGETGNLTRTYGLSNSIWILVPIPLILIVLTVVGLIIHKNVRDLLIKYLRFE